VPRHVDHGERRRSIAEAILRLVSEKGVEAASLRAVAAEAGVSMGAVQHYFGSTAEMLRFALDYGNGLLAARIQHLLAQRRGGTPREALRLCCTLLLPLDADSRAGARLWAAFIAHGCVDAPTGKLAADAYAGLVSFLAAGIGKAAPQRPPDGADPSRAALHLVSVIEGLRWPLLFGICTEQEALAVLDSELDQILEAV
jgi:TetR/AcrR family transcriptional regulator, transcriptional repressor of bet genes